MVIIPAFQAGDMGSNPVSLISNLRRKFNDRKIIGVTDWEISVVVIIPAFQAGDMGPNPVSLITNPFFFFSLKKSISEVRQFALFNSPWTNFRVY